MKTTRRRAPSKQLKRIEHDVNYVYVIRRRDDGEAVYVGMTSNPSRRMRDHTTKGVLANFDADDYEMCVVAAFAGGRQVAFNAEYNLTEHLRNNGAQLLNEQPGNDQVWRKRPFCVVDVVNRVTGKFAMSMISQGDPWSARGNFATLYGAQKRHRQWLPGELEQYDMRLVVDSIAQRDDAFLAMVDHWAAVRNNLINPLDGQLLPTAWLTEDERVKVMHKRELRRCATQAARAKSFVLCVDTGDLFAFKEDAAAWAGCSPENIYRAIKNGNSCTAGNLHWQRVSRDELTTPQLKAVHMPRMLREADGLPPEHIDSTVVKRKHAVIHWMVNDNNGPASRQLAKKLPDDKRWLCTVVHDKNAMVMARSTLSQVVAALANMSWYTVDDEYTVNARIISAGYARHACRLERIKLREQNLLVNNVEIDYKTTTWRAAATRIERGGKALVCCETGEVLTSPSALATRSGLTKSMVYARVKSGAIVNGQRWQEVSVNELTEQQELEWRRQLMQMRCAGGVNKERVDDVVLTTNE